MTARGKTTLYILIWDWAPHFCCVSAVPDCSVRYPVAAARLPSTRCQTLFGSPLVCNRPTLETICVIYSIHGNLNFIIDIARSILHVRFQC
jgi:hypothetical protein